MAVGPVEDGRAPSTNGPRRNARPPSMNDVALAAGVSHQTVSRVLNHNSHVAKDTRERVLEAISALGYRRNSAARALATNRSATIGVVTVGSALYGPTNTLNGVEVAAREQGLYVSLATMKTIDGPTTLSTIGHLLDQGVDGIIVIAPQQVMAEAIAEMGAPVPIVMISATDEKAAGKVLAVSVDHGAGARMATEHLTGLGHREIVHLSGPQYSLDAQARVAGWQAQCAADGLDAQVVVEGDWSADCGYAVGTAMAREGAPTSIFAANDQLALGLLRAFWEAGMTVPRDVSVVGVADVADAANFIPPLTTIRQDFEALGSLAITSLLARLEQDAGDVGLARATSARTQVRAATITPRLKVRQSTAGPLARPV